MADFKLLRHAHSAVKPDRLLAHGASGLADLRLRHRGICHGLALAQSYGNQGSQKPNCRIGRTCPIACACSNGVGLLRSPTRTCGRLRQHVRRFRHARSQRRARRLAALSGRILDPRRRRTPGTHHSMFHICRQEAPPFQPRCIPCAFREDCLIETNKIVGKRGRLNLKYTEPRFSGRINGPVAGQQVVARRLTTLLAITVFTPAVARCLLLLSWLQRSRPWYLMGP
jgi:hypothetical protein